MDFHKSLLFILSLNLSSSLLSTFLPLPIKKRDPRNYYKEIKESDREITRRIFTTLLFLFIPFSHFSSLLLPTSFLFPYKNKLLKSLPQKRELRGEQRTIQPARRISTPLIAPFHFFSPLLFFLSSHFPFSSLKKKKLIAKR